MKVFTRCLLLCGALVGLSAAASAQTLYDNFENTRRLNYTYVDGVFTQNAANPAVGTANPSPTVGQYQRNAAVQFDVVVFKPQLAPRFVDVSAYVAGTSSVTMKVYSPVVGRQFQLVMQDKVKATTGYPNGNLGGTFEATTTVANTWETLTFVFTPGTSDPTVLPTDIDQMVLLIGPSTNTGDTYYIDDLSGPDFGALPPPVVEQLYDDFEGTRVLNYQYQLTSGGLNPDTANPAIGPGNSSARVGRYTRSSNQYDVLVARPQQSVRDVAGYLSNAKRMTLKVYSPAAGIPLQITMQDSSVAGATNYPLGRHSEYLATTSVANAWETVVFTNSARPDPAISNTSVNEFVLLIASNTFAPLKVFLDDWYGPAQVGFTGLAEDTNVATDVAAWPNPANDRATIGFTLAQPAAVTVSLYDLQGRLVVAPQPAGLKTVGRQTLTVPTAGLATGLYRYQLTIGTRTVGGKLSVVR